MSLSLAETIHEEGGLLAGVLRDDAASAPAPEAAAFGPARELAADAVHEGYLLHYGEGRVLGGPDDDLLLLGADRLYALGLDRLAQAGDLDAVAALASVIARCAQAHASGDAISARQAWAEGAARA